MSEIFPAPLTIYDLRELILATPEAPYLTITADSWREMRQFVGPESVVVATEHRPPFFWLLDKKIVTPAYELADSKGLADTLAPRHCDTCRGEHDSLRHLTAVRERAR